MVGSYHSHSAVGIEFGLRQHDGGPKSEYQEPQVLAYRRTCEHEGEPVPGTVLDPFAGSGAALLAAQRLGRRSIGIELRADYVTAARARLRADAPLLEQEAER